jgi:hypothetical protein
MLRSLFSRFLLAAALCVAVIPPAASADLADVPTPGAACGQPGAGGSLLIGAVIGTTEVNGIAQPRTVLDMNAISGFSSKNTMGTGTQYAGLEPVGWVYRDDQHNFWFQKAPSVRLDRPFGGSTLRDVIARSFGVPPDMGADAMPMGISPGALDEHFQASPCFLHGDQFYPHEINPSASP